MRRKGGVRGISQTSNTSFRAVNNVSVSDLHPPNILLPDEKRPLSLIICWCKQEAEAFILCGCCSAVQFTLHLRSLDLLLLYMLDVGGLEQMQQVILHENRTTMW